MRRCGTMPTMLMYPQIDPVALQIGPLAVHWYGLTYLAAFGLFLWLGTRRLRHPPIRGTRRHRCPEPSGEEAVEARTPVAALALREQCAEAAAAQSIDLWVAGWLGRVCEP